MLPHEEKFAQELRDAMRRAHFFPYGLPIHHPSFKLMSVSYGATGGQTHITNMGFNYAADDRILTPALYVVSLEREIWQTQVGTHPALPQAMGLGRLQGISMSILYPRLLAQLANPDETYGVMSEQLETTLRMKFHGLEVASQRVTELEYEPYTLWLTFNTDLPTILFVGGIDLSREAFDALLEELMPLNLHDPEIQTFIIDRMVETLRSLDKRNQGDDVQRDG